jgi:pimeloyl-ACP methyl ester carboxylesterase
MASYEKWEVAGIETEIMFMNSPAASKVLLFVPGNPGIAQFYEQYLAELHSQTNGTLEIICASYPGHFSKLSEALSLKQQIEHKLALLIKVRKTYPTLDIILAGHSLGCYINLNLLSRSPDRIIQVIALFPTIHSMAETPQGRIIKWLALPSIRMTLHLLVRSLTLILPPVLLRTIVGTVTGHQGQILDTTFKFISGGHGLHAYLLLTLV